LLPAPIEADEQLPELQPEVDLQKLQEIQFRRAVLAWRDKYIVGIKSVADDSFRRFSDWMDTEINDVSLFSQVFAKEAGEVLLPTFRHMVRDKLLAVVAQAEENIFHLLATWPSISWRRVQFSESREEIGTQWIDEIKFKPTNQDDLTQRLTTLMYGDQGLVDAFQRQLVEACSTIIRTREMTE